MKHRLNTDRAGGHVTSHLVPEKNPCLIRVSSVAYDRAYNSGEFPKGSRMTRPSQAILDAALTLPESERVFIVENLLESLSGDPAESDEEISVAELDRRAARHGWRNLLVGAQAAKMRLGRRTVICVNLCNPRISQISADFETSNYPGSSFYVSVTCREIKTSSSAISVGNAVYVSHETSSRESCGVVNDHACARTGLRGTWLVLLGVAGIVARSQRRLLDVSQGDLAFSRRSYLERRRSRTSAPRVKICRRLSWLSQTKMAGGSARDRDRGGCATSLERTECIRR